MVNNISHSSVTAPAMGTYGSYKASSDNTAGLQAAMQEADWQTASGQISQYYNGTAATARESLNTKIARHDLDQILDNIEVVKDRATRSEDSIKKLLEVSKEFRTRLKGNMNPGQTDAGFQEYCKNALIEVQNALNVRDVNGNALFGGQEVVADPFDASLIPVPGLSDPVSKAAFKGTPDVLYGRIGINNTQQVSMPGHLDAYMELFHALKIGASYTPDHRSGSENMLILEKAQDMAGKAEQEISEQLQSVKNIQSILVALSEKVENQKNQLIEKQKQMDTIDTLEAYYNAETIRSQLFINQLIFNKKMNFEQKILDSFA